MQIHFYFGKMPCWTKLAKQHLLCRAVFTKLISPWRGLSVSIALVTSYYKLNILTQHSFSIFQFCRSETWHGSHMAKSWVLRGLCSFCRLQEGLSPAILVPSGHLHPWSTAPPSLSKAGSGWLSPFRTSCFSGLFWSPISQSIQPRFSVCEDHGIELGSPWQPRIIDWSQGPITFITHRKVHL